MKQFIFANFFLKTTKLLLVFTFFMSLGLTYSQSKNPFVIQADLNFTEFLMRLTPDRAPNYSRAVMEVLAIIAYRQPVTRADIEKVRGVSLNSNTLRQLIEREWVDIIGQKEVPGRPSLFATTKHFLNDFSLKSLSELPELNSSLTKELSDSQTDQSIEESQES